MQKLLILICIIFSLQMSAQHITGKVYDDEAIVSGAKVINKSKNTMTFTDTSGNFKLEATINDSIVFKSLFHHDKLMILKKSDFDDTIVIELKKAVNDLDEVLLNKEPDAKPFDAVETNTTMRNQILEDIKRNPHLYSKGSNGNMDFIAIAKLIVSLFKSKRPKEEAITFVSYNQLVKLFETDFYFNDKFLKTELKIEEDYKYLFYQFCEATSIESKLLLVENRFYLLDNLLKCSDAFLEIVNSDQKD